LEDADHPFFLSRHPAPVSRSRTPQKPAQPQPVGDLVSRFLEKSGLRGKVEAASALTNWAERVGPQIAAVTTPTGLADDTLFVSVATSAWMMELSMIKGELVKRVNAGKKEGKIRHIVFVMAS
jgi:predicted nucleic acid-binding Zn ribbon protein